MPSRTTALTALLLLTSGCAAPPTGPDPEPSLHQAEEALQLTEGTAAAELAALELRMAEDKLAQARSIVAAGDSEAFERARRLAEQAELDARLAAVKTEVAQLHRLRRQLRQTLDLLTEPDGGAP